MGWPVGHTQQREPVTEAPVRGHARGRVVVDHRRGGDEALRGVPVIGVGAGAVRGTRPGDSVRELERAGRDLVYAALARKRLNHAARLGRMEPSSRPR